MPAHRRSCGLLLIVGAVLYTSWLLQLLLPSGTSLRSSFASELAADGQPWAWLYRGADLVAGAVFVACGLLCARHPGPVGGRSGAAGRAIPALVAVFGLAIVVDALCPLSCTPTVDAACAARELAGQVPWRHRVHTWSSVTEGVALWALLVLALWRRPRRGAGAQRRERLLLVLTLAWVAATAWTLAAVELTGPAHSWLGLAQRVQLALSTGCLLTLGWQRWRRSPQQRGPQQPSPRGTCT